MNRAIPRYKPQGSWSDALEKLTQELVEVEQEGWDDREQIVCCLQRLEELDDQVGKSCAKLDG